MTQGTDVQKTDLYDQGLMTVVAVGLALCGITGFGRHYQRGDHAWDHGIADAFNWLREHRPDLDIRFRVILHPMYDDSPVAYGMLVQGVGRGLFTLDTDGDYHLRFSSEYAPLYLERLPFTADQARDLARIVLQKYGR